MSDTNIVTECPTCGSVALTQRDIHVLVLDCDPTVGTYSFRCPLCQHPVVVKAKPKTLDLLIAAGAKYRFINLSPSEFRLDFSEITEEEIQQFIADLGQL